MDRKAGVLWAMLAHIEQHSGASPAGNLGTFVVYSSREGQLVS